MKKRIEKLLKSNDTETTMRITALEAQKLGLITITRFWVIRGGVPGQSANGIKPGSIITTFELTEAGRIAIAALSER